MTSRSIPALAAVVAAATLTSCGGGGGGGGGAAGGADLTGADLPTAQEVANSPLPLAFDTGPLPPRADISANRALPPVRKQSLSDCIAFAFGYELASFEVATSGGFNADQISHQASPADLYAKLLAKENRPCNSFTRASDALDILVRDGVPSLAQSPYVGGQCVNAATGGTFGIGGYHVVKPSDTISIKQTLAGGHPVGALVNLYDGMRPWGDAHHDDSVFTATGAPNPAGGHGMLMVGYDDSKNAWKFMNSWGAEWANQGFFWMSYDAFAASARACYVVDGGGTTALNDPGTPVTFVSFKALEYQSHTTSARYLVMPFQFDHAAYIVQARMVFGGAPPPGATAHTATPWTNVNHWLTKSYLWWTANTPYAAGNYTLELDCKTTAGAPYTIRQTAAKAFGGYTRG